MENILLQNPVVGYDEMAKLVGMHPGSLKRMMYEGKLDDIKVLGRIGHTLLLDRDDVQAFVERRAQDKQRRKENKALALQRTREQRNKGRRTLGRGDFTTRFTNPAGG